MSKVTVGQKSKFGKVNVFLSLRSVRLRGGECPAVCVCVCVCLHIFCRC